MRSFDFPSLQSDPEIPGGNDNTAEIRGLPSDLCGQKILQRDHGRTAEVSLGWLNTRIMLATILGPRVQDIEHFSLLRCGTDIVGVI